MPKADTLTEVSSRIACRKALYIILRPQAVMTSGDPCGNRTRVTGVRGRCLDRLTNGPWLASRLRRSVALRRRSLKGLATLWIRACVVFDDPSLRSGSSVMCACRRIFHVGAPSGTRTRDPLIKSQLLYQLS